ncbi:MAG: hypothetical protein MR364_06555, partial [Oscillospiraceae bacterium]|nr:hypothetical protein [Oscillospiraceae bacterium]
ITLNGLGTYNRTDGYTTNPITYTYETRVLTMDRGKRLRIDALDVDETGFGLAAANIAAEFQRVKVIPEIDSYRYSTLSKNAAITKVYAPDKKTVLSTLLGQLGEVREVTGGEGELVIAMSRPVYDMIMLSSEVTHSLDCGNFSQGELEFTVKTINGVSIIPVPSARMKTDYVFDKNDGFSPADSAKQINWIICPRTAPIAISKTDNLKIITPEQNQFADAWDIDYRKYHDIFIPDNKKAAIALCTAE